MARYTHDVLSERDLMAMLRDHMSAVESKLDAALFTGPTPLLDEKLEPWSLALLVELAVRHTKSAEIPRMAIMMIVAKTLGIETIPAPFLDHLRSSVPIAADVATPAGTDAQQHATDTRGLDFEGSGVTPGAKVRVVKAANVTETVMSALAEHPLTKDAFDHAEREELGDLFKTLCEKITAMLDQRLM